MDPKGIPGAMRSSRTWKVRSRGALAARLAALGLVRQKEYLVTGTRKQFWQEEFCKAVIQVGGSVCIYTFQQYGNISYGTAAPSHSFVWTIWLLTGPKYTHGQLVQGTRCKYPLGTLIESVRIRGWTLKITNRKGGLPEFYSKNKVRT